MEQVTLTSKKPVAALRPLVESALRAELRALQVGLHRTEARLRTFEEQYGMSTEEFYHKITNDEIDETLDTIEWGGEYQTWLRLRKKIETLRGVQVED